jgi:hypothetical protein
MLYGFGTFLPIILKNGFSYPTKEAQYFVVPDMTLGFRSTCLFTTLKDLPVPSNRRQKVLHRMPKPESIISFSFE